MKIFFVDEEIIFVGWSFFFLFWLCDLWFCWVFYDFDLWSMMLKKYFFLFWSVKFFFVGAMNFFLFYDEENIFFVCVFVFFCFCLCWLWFFLFWWDWIVHEWSCWIV